MSQKDIIYEHNDALVKFTNEENNSVLEINWDGSWTFPAPHLPEIQSPQQGEDILSLFSCAILACYGRNPKKVNTKANI